MNKTLLIVAGILFSAGVLTSCSITRRVYSNGYHVEWKHGREDAGTAGDMAGTNEREFTLDAEESYSSAVSKEKIISKAKEPAEEKSPRASRHKTSVDQGQKNVIQPFAASPQTRLLPPSPDPQPDPLGKLAMYVSIVSICTLPVVGSLLGVILGFISLSRTRRHPERYQGTKQANAAIIIGMLTIVAVVLILIIVTVY